MRKVLTLTILLFLLPSTLLADYLGILVTFKSDNPLVRDQLHQKLNTEMMKRFSSISVDWVVPKNENLEGNKQALESLCKKYRDDSNVEKCSLNGESSLPQSNSLSADSRCKDEETGAIVELETLSKDIEEMNPTTQQCLITNKDNLPDLTSNDGVEDVGANYLGKDISPLWAQELTGADLAYKLLAEEKEERAKNNQQIEVKDGVIEHFFSPEQIKDLKLSSNSLVTNRKTTKGLSASRRADAISHSSNVISLMIDKYYGVSPVAKISLASEGRYSSSIIEGLEKASMNGTQIINMSLSCAGEEAYSAVQQAIDRGIIVVTASGNNFAQGQKEIDFCKTDSRLIVAGSISPLGTVSDFSQQGENVTILAPGDYWTPSAIRGTPTTFGGTSASSPQVKGALDNVLALLPNLDSIQLKTMLIKSSTPSVATSGNLNGKGVLNAFKLAKVALKIEKVVSKIEDPIQRQSEIARLIDDNGTYDLKEDALKALTEAKELLASNDCQKQREGFTVLRKSFLLHPTDDAKNLMVNNYMKEKRSATAELYRSLTPESKEYLATISKPLQELHFQHLQEISE